MFFRQNEALQNECTGPTKKSIAKKVLAQKIDTNMHLSGTNLASAPITEEGTVSLVPGGTWQFDISACNRMVTSSVNLFGLCHNVRAVFVPVRNVLEFLTTDHPIFRLGDFTDCTFRSHRKIAVQQILHPSHGAPHHCNLDCMKSAKQGQLNLPCC